MQIKRFVAPTMAEAIASVRDEFGPDAVILHTGRSRHPGIMGLFRPTWVAVTAGLESQPMGEPSQGMGYSAASKSADAHPASMVTLEPDKATPLCSPVCSKDDPGCSPTKLSELAVTHLIERLRQQEVEPGYVADLVDELRQRVYHNGEAPQQHLVKLLASRVPYPHAWPVYTSQVVVPLVGPTGVGKTTTLAKLAAMYSLLKGVRVGLLTADTYRIAAVEQLRTYADILNIPLGVLYTPEDVKPALARMQDRQLILVDTAGRSPHHHQQMSELTAFLAAMTPCQPHLVLSATTRHTDMVDIVDAFRAHVAIEGLVMTKLDETHTYGCLYNAVRRTGKPMVFITNGQDVPEDVVAADPDYLARLLVGVEAC